MYSPHHYETITHVDGEEFARELTTLGIVLRPESGAPHYIPDSYGELWKEIGRVAVYGDGGIELYPYRNAAQTDLDVLRGVGIDAWRRPPSTAEHWVHRTGRRGGHWECIIKIPAFHADPHVRTIRTTERHEVLQDREFAERYGSASAA
jgi:hypothetical protein